MHRETCHPYLQELFDIVLPAHDATWIWGFRGEEAQDEAFRLGNSKLRWPNSVHNNLVDCEALGVTNLTSINKARGDTDAFGFDRTCACDVAPWFPRLCIPWKDQRAFDLFAGHVFQAAYEIGIRDQIRWGGDWDRDMNLNDQIFNDLAHWELIL